MKGLRVIPMLFIPLTPHCLQKYRVIQSTPCWRLRHHTVAGSYYMVNVCSLCSCSLEACNLQLPAFRTYGEVLATIVKQHISPLAVFQMNCLRRICGISLRDHVPSADILNRCNTLYVESQLQGKRLMFLRMPNDRLPKKLLFGQVKGLRPSGRPRSSFNDVALQHCQARGINRLYRDAQDRLLWKDKTCPART